MRSARASSSTASLDRAVIPSRTVLVGQQHERAVGVEARVRARQVEAHERQQAEHLGLVRHEPRDQRGQPFGVAGEVAALGQPRRMRPGSPR